MEHNVVPSSSPAALVWFLCLSNQVRTAVAIVLGFPAYFVTQPFATLKGMSQCHTNHDQPARLCVVSPQVSRQIATGSTSSRMRRLNGGRWTSLPSSQRSFIWRHDGVANSFLISTRVTHCMETYTGSRMPCIDCDLKASLQLLLVLVGFSGSR